MRGKYFNFKKNCLHCDKEIVKLANYGKTKWLNRKFCSRRCSGLHLKGKPTGIKHTDEFKRAVSLRHTGKINSIESRRKMAISKFGKNNPNWRGGVTPIHTQIRMGLEYRLWRESVFKRDNFTCIWCNRKGGWSKNEKRQIYLNADHIKPFAHYPELRFAIDNGRTLCVECHRTTKTYGAIKLTTDN